MLQGRGLPKPSQVRLCPSNQGKNMLKTSATLGRCSAGPIMADTKEISSSSRRPVLFAAATRSCPLCSTHSLYRLLQ